MRTKFLFLFVFIMSSWLFILGQVPQGFNYQAIARDGSGNPIVNTAMPVRITIQSELTGGTVFWQELHSSITTNDFGMFTLVVGQGTRQGGTANTFDEIDWTVTPKYIKTEIDYNGWKEMGVSQLWSVPYANVSKNSEQWQSSGSNLYRTTGNVGIGTNTPTGKLSIQPPSTWPDEQPLFEVKNKLGTPVLAVYNNGVKILVEDTDGKGVKGGFAIGGFDPTKAGEETVDLMIVTPDSIRLNIDNNPAKATKGGFAIGGFDASKSLNPREFMYVTPQASANGEYNTFIGYQAGYSNTTGTNNVFLGYKSGFNNATGSSNALIGTLSGYNLKKGSRNTFLGHKAGYSYWAGSSGYSNVFIGDSAGYDNNTGYRNVFIGSGVGPKNTSGYNNVFIGYEAGYSNWGGYSNTFIGTEAGRNATLGYDNVYIGYRTGYAGHGQYNVMIGHEAGLNNAGGSLNTFIGKSAGRENTTGHYNTLIGLEAGKNITTGEYNVAIGSFAGRDVQEGSGNIFIGYNAGSTEVSLNNRLYIGSFPLIYGEFNTMVVIKGKNNPNLNTFYVNGSSDGIGDWNAASDMRLKTNITPISGALEKVCALRGVEFEWIDKEKYDCKKHIGFIGQEVYDVLPEVVDNTNDFYSVQYGVITSLLVEAVKEQQKIIETSKQENQQLKTELEELRQKVASIEALLTEIK
ncbi:MAG: tail fiber domain-containing protein [Bacteroidales bacterium]